MKEVLYLFCFTQTNDLPTIESQAIEQYGPLFIHCFLGINAVLGRVSDEEYNSESMKNKISDPAWVTPRLLHHEEIVEKVMRHSPVFPVRFGTLFSSLASLEEQMCQHHTFISAFLAKVDQHDEWSIRGFLDQAIAVEKIFSDTLEEKKAFLSECAPGIRYLNEQRIRNDIKNKLSIYLRDIYENVLNKISLNVVDFKKRETSSNLSDSRGKDVVHWAFLISRKVILEFQVSVDQINRDYAPFGLHFNLTGPWPAYSFCHVEQP